jgi:hypothetical protein
MMAGSPLLFFFLWALRGFALWLLPLVWVAGWLRLIPQAEQQKAFDLLFKGFNNYQNCIKPISNDPS